ncbi:hypothetical protein GWE18_15095 [Bradyrhizobium sp. CSA112]|uniref:hypothetical protein n=1 Tax=Bradyrhizobium sp. CSA112 TaxID=2699170 RepID=UPI0023AEED25|nr:hypothetical protein [Bradyrhizobium sp. CSA112]MDE5454153.1 hypothetical protein [Bradyrhizobium sp. CSA112]
MSIEELFELHQQMQSVLREKLLAKWAALLEDRLRQLNQPASDAASANPTRRAKPPI